MKKLLFSALVFSVFFAVGCGEKSDPKFSDSDITPDNETEDESSDYETSDVIQDDNETSDQSEVKNDEIADLDKNDEAQDFDEVPDNDPGCIGTELKCEGTKLYSCDNGNWKVEKDC